MKRFIQAMSMLSISMLTIGTTIADTGDETDKKQEILNEGFVEKYGEVNNIFDFVTYKNGEMVITPLEEVNGYSEALTRKEKKLFKKKYYAIINHLKYPQVQLSYSPLDLKTITTGIMIDTRDRWIYPSFRFDARLVDEYDTYADMYDEQVNICTEFRETGSKSNESVLEEDMKRLVSLSGVNDFVKDWLPQDSIEYLDGLRGKGVELNFNYTYSRPRPYLKLTNDRTNDTVRRIAEEHKESFHRQRKDSVFADKFYLEQEQLHHAGQIDEENRRFFIDKNDAKDLPIHTQKLILDEPYKMLAAYLFGFGLSDTNSRLERLDPDSKIVYSELCKEKAYYKRMTDQGMFNGYAQYDFEGGYFANVLGRFGGVYDNSYGGKPHAKFVFDREDVVWDIALPKNMEVYKHVGVYGISTTREGDIRLRGSGSVPVSGTLSIMDGVFTDTGTGKIDVFMDLSYAEYVEETSVEFARERVVGKVLRWGRGHRDYIENANLLKNVGYAIYSQDTTDINPELFANLSLEEREKWRSLDLGVLTGPMTEAGVRFHSQILSGLTKFEKKDFIKLQLDVVSEMEKSQDKAERLMVLGQYIKYMKLHGTEEEKIWKDYFVDTVAARCTDKDVSTFSGLDLYDSFFNHSDSPFSDKEKAKYKSMCIKGAQDYLKFQWQENPCFSKDVSIWMHQESTKNVLSKSTINGILARNKSYEAKCEAKKARRAAERRSYRSSSSGNCKVYRFSSSCGMMSGSTYCASSKYAKYSQFSCPKVATGATCSCD